ncbi:MAG: hypothetical protein ACPGQL_05650, partial [Thermoplasmatota archaeon]
MRNQAIFLLAVFVFAATSTSALHSTPPLTGSGSLTSGCLNFNIIPDSVEPKPQCQIGPLLPLLHDPPSRLVSAQCPPSAILEWPGCEKWQEYLEAGARLNDHSWTDGFKLVSQGSDVVLATIFSDESNGLSFLRLDKVSPDTGVRTKILGQSSWGAHYIQSLTLHDGIIYGNTRCSSSGNCGGYLFAVDAESGDELWSRELNVWLSDLVWTPSGLIGISIQHMNVYSLQDGSFLRSMRVEPPPGPENDRVFVMSGIFAGDSFYTVGVTFGDTGSEVGCPANKSCSYLAKMNLATGKNDWVAIENYAPLGNRGVEAIEVDDRIYLVILSVGQIPGFEWGYNTVVTSYDIQTGARGSTSAYDGNAGARPLGILSRDGEVFVYGLAGFSNE